MKRILMLVMLTMSLFLISGCGKYKKENLTKDLTKKIENMKTYKLNGILEIINNEEKYLYDVEVKYKKEEMYRVSLKNKTNNHEQIILKNNEGVYV